MRRSSVNHLWFCAMRGYILERNHFPASFVRGNLVTLRPCKDIGVFIQEKNHTRVIFVKSSSVQLLERKLIKWLISPNTLISNSTDYDYIKKMEYVFFVILHYIPIPVYIMSLYMSWLWSSNHKLFIPLLHESKAKTLLAKEPCCTPPHPPLPPQKKNM